MDFRYLFFFSLKDNVVKGDRSDLIGKSCACGEGKRYDERLKGRVGMGEERREMEGRGMGIGMMI